MIVVWELAYISKEVLNGVHNFMNNMAFTRIEGKC